MANEENNENNKVQVGLRMDAELFGAISSVAAREERTVSNTIFWLLKQTPQIQEMLEAETAATA